MKNPEQFVKSVDILVDAYENGNLRHLSPCNCAVGNLIAYSQGTYDYESKTGGSVASWTALIDAIRRNGLVGTNNVHQLCETGSTTYFRSKSSGPLYNINIAKFQAETTGYTINEIEKIEAAFEKIEIINESIQERRSNRDEDPMDGLLKAVSVLGEIHEIPEETLHCMKEKIQTNTYTKSFEFQIPEGSIYGKEYPGPSAGDITTLVDSIIIDLSIDANGNIR